MNVFNAGRSNQEDLKRVLDKVIEVTSGNELSPTVNVANSWRSHQNISNKIQG